jgi:hypothetical protein
MKRQPFDFFLILDPAGKDVRIGADIAQKTAETALDSVAHLVCLNYFALPPPVFDY